MGYLFNGRKIDWCYYGKIARRLYISLLSRIPERVQYIATQASTSICLPVYVCPLDTTVSRAETDEPVRDAVSHV